MMLNKQFKVTVSQDFLLPPVYNDGSIEEVEEALWIGANIQQSIRTRRSNDEVRKITEIKNCEIEQIRNEYNSQITKLLDEIRSVSSEKDKIQGEYTMAVKLARESERDNTVKVWEEKLRVLKRDHDILSSRYDALEARKRELEDSREADIQNAVKRNETLMQKIVDSKQDTLDRLQASYKQLQDVIMKNSDEISKLGNTIGKRAANVKNRGSDYEDEFREKLVRAFGVCRGFTLRDTRLGMGHEMDFAMSIEGNNVMWELKNYTSVVPKAEVDKFLRDLKENPQVKIGVMISRSTDIYGKASNGPLLVEFEQDKMMIYISKFEEYCGGDENRTFQMIGALFRIWWEYGKEDKTGIDKVELIRELEKILEDIAKRRTEWRRHKAHLDEIGRWTNDLLDESENRLDKMLKKLRSCDDENNTPIVIPTDVFRDLDGEREKLWMDSIMRVCQVGGEIEIRELVELLAGHHKVTKDTIRSNIMSVVRDSAVGKKGVIKYIQGITRKVEPCQIMFNHST